MVVPEPISELIEELFASAGVHAVVIGGSRAIGHEQPHSDWDLGVYYRGEPDLSALAARGEVHPPGAWGRIMNGGSWLDVGSIRVDVLLRDLDVVDHWTTEAESGRFEIDGLPGYIAGIPTYSLTAEANLCRPIRGSIETSSFPEALRALGSQRWRFNRDFSLYHAEQHARRGNVAGTLGQAARAVFEEAHARCCAAGTWVLNEKHVVGAAGLDEVPARLQLDGAETSHLVRLVADVRDRLLEASDAV